MFTNSILVFHRPNSKKKGKKYRVLYQFVLLVFLHQWYWKRKKNGFFFLHWH